VVLRSVGRLFSRVGRRVGADAALGVGGGGRAPSVAWPSVSPSRRGREEIPLVCEGVIALSQAQDETVNLADLPLDSLESIEVYRGTVPVAFAVRPDTVAVSLTDEPGSVSSAAVATVTIVG